MNKAASSVMPLNSNVGNNCQENNTKVEDTFNMRNEEKKVALLNEMSKKGLLPVSDRVDLMRADFNLKKQQLEEGKRQVVFCEGDEIGQVKKVEASDDEGEDSEPKPFTNN